MAKKRKQQTAKKPATGKPPKRSRNHKTAKDPFEAAADDTHYTVKRITNKEWRKSIPYYEVEWDVGPAGARYQFG